MNKDPSVDANLARCFTKKLTWHQFYGKLIIVMKKWDNRIVVPLAPELAL